MQIQIQIQVQISSERRCGQMFERVNEEEGSEDCVVVKMSLNI